MKALNTFLKFVTTHYVFSLIFSLLIFLPFLLNVPRVKKVSSVDDFKLHDHPDFIFYDKVKEIFGNDEFFVIAFERDTVFSRQNLAMLRNITEGLEELEEVRKVKSLTNIDYIEGGEDYFQVTKFLSELPKNNEAFAQLAQKAIEEELYLSNLISQDAKTAAIVVYTYDRPGDTEYRKKLINKTNLILEKYRTPDIKFHISGWTKINYDLTTFIDRDTSIFIPITYLLIIIMVWLFYRNMRLTIIAFLNISICLFSTIGLFAVSGITLNNVTSLVPSLVMALSLSDTVHIFSHLNKSILNRYADKREALLETLKQVSVPCFMTTLTTAAGFASLMVNELDPIKDFGFIAAIGMILEFVFSFLFLPPLILLCNPHKIFTIWDENNGRMERFLFNLLKVIRTNKKSILASGIIATLISLYFATTIRVETNFVEYFKKQSEVRKSIDFVEKKMSGVGSLDISFQSTEENAFLNPDNLKMIENVQHFLESNKGVDLTTSLVEFLKDMNKSFHNEVDNYYTLPESRQLIAQYMLLYDSDEITEFVNDIYTHTKISARLSIHSSMEQQKLIDNVEEYIKKIDTPENMEIKVTGRALESVRIIDSLVTGQILSLILASCVIGLCMFAVLKSIPLGLLSLLLNLFPLLVNFGCMGLWGISLNTATALISAVAIGIVVDDTIHFVSEYNRQRLLGRNRALSVERVMLKKGRAILTTSLILSAGFGVLVFSNFIPTVQFGILSALLMLIAVLGDLVLLPAILLLDSREN